MREIFVSGVDADLTTDVVVILCTAPPDVAADMAEQMVQSRMVACVNIVPIQSTYRWKEKVCNDAEFLMIAKTTKNLAEAAVEYLRSLHPYDVPEILILPVNTGYAPYLDWVRKETGGS